MVTQIHHKDCLVNVSEGACLGTFASFKENIFPRVSHILFWVLLTGEPGVCGFYV